MFGWKTKNPKICLQRVSVSHLLHRFPFFIWRVVVVGVHLQHKIDIIFVAFGIYIFAKQTLTRFVYFSFFFSFYFRYRVLLYFCCFLCFSLYHPQHFCLFCALCTYNMMKSTCSKYIELNTQHYVCVIHIQCNVYG